MKKGKFIVIEGVDGAGKGTQIDLFKKYLQDNKLENDFIFVREPGGTKPGDDIRNVILNHSGISSKTETLLFYASRRELLKNKIIPNLESGKNVICDRYELSTFAYQIYGRERENNRKLIEFLQEEISVIPDKYYFFDVDVEISKERSNLRDSKNTRFDNEGIAFFDRLRDGYRKEIKRYNHKIIDTSKDIKDTSIEFLKDIKDFLKIK